MMAVVKTGTNKHFISLTIMKNFFYYGEYFKITENEVLHKFNIDQFSF